MRYSVLGFKQEDIIKYSLDMNDVLLLDYIYNACGSPSMKKTHDDNDQPYVWLQHKKVLEDLPVLGFGEDMLKKRLRSLSEKELISSVIRSDEIRGRRTYYTVTIRCESMRFSDQVEKITLDTTDENDQVEKIPLGDIRPSGKNSPSDNKLNIDNKLYTNTTNVVLEQPAVTPTTSSVTKTSSSTVRRKLLCPSSDNINTVSKKDNKVTGNKVTSNTGYTRDMGVVSPIKKKSLYEKCIDAINEFTDNEEIKNLLVDYLKLRLEMVSYPLYANQWKGCLKHLKELQDSGEDTIAVIKQSIMYSKRGFDPVYKFNNRKKFAEGSRGLKLGMNKNEVITNEAF